MSATMPTHVNTVCTFGNMCNQELPIKPCDKETASFVYYSNKSALQSLLREVGHSIGVIPVLPVGVFRAQNGAKCFPSGPSTTPYPRNFSCTSLGIRIFSGCLNLP